MPNGLSKIFQSPVAGLASLVMSGLLAWTAAPALALDITSTEVTKGETELRNVNVVGWDKHGDGGVRHAHDFQLGYGFTDELNLKAILNIQRGDGTDASCDGSPTTPHLGPRKNR